MVKLKDIARETGLTISTVSKALSHSHEISKATAQIVLDTACAMGYTARKPLRRAVKTIGVILPEVRSHYYAELMHSLSAEIERHGYCMIAMLTSRYSASLEPCAQKMFQHELDGLFVSCGGAFTEQTHQMLVDSGIPTLLLTETEQPFFLDSIYIKDEAGIRQAVDHLTQLGHQKIGYLGEFNSDNRYYSCCEALKQNDLEVIPAFVKRGSERFEEGGYLRALELLRQPELPTAVFASYDQVAYGAMRAFREHGVRIPEDISVIGFDNIIMDAYYPVPLTSITNPVEQMGITAVKILLDAIEHPETHVVQNVALQSRLVIRNSTCPPRQTPKG